MAIVRMSKMTLAAPQKERDKLLDLIQGEGCVHLIDLKAEAADIEGVEYFIEAKTVSQTEIDYNHIKFTYDFLKHYSEVKDGLFSKREILSKNDFDKLEEIINWRDIYSQAKKIEDSINLSKANKNKVIALMDQYKQWVSLDVNENELGSMKNVSYYTGSISKKYEPMLYDDLQKQFNDVYIEKVFESQQDVNLLILLHKSDSQNVFDILKKYGFVKTNLSFEEKPEMKISNLNSELEELDKNLKALTLEAKELAENLNEVEKIFDYITSKLDREKAISKLIKTKKTFILQGWVPEGNTKQLENTIINNFKNISIDFEEPEADEEFPVALKNSAIAEPFEAITSMYALPLPREVDPTPVLTPFFLLFFGMMMADMGYGIVMAVVSTLGLKYMDVEGNTKKILKLAQYCSIPTIIFGLLYGSFFGGIIKMKPLWLDPVNEPMTVLYVSVALGMVHLFVGLGVKAYSLIKAGNILDAVYDVLLWYVLIIGLILLLLGGGTIAKVLSIAGAIGLLATQGRSNESIVGKFFGGLYGLYGVTGYLGDALSYSRLLALGLSSGLIGWSFNLLIDLLGGGPIKFVFGPIIFLAGHTFNFLIGILGVFVHTSRLQYLEFFGKFYEGGGAAFNPLKINTKFIKIKAE